MDGASAPPEEHSSLAGPLADGILALVCDWAAVAPGPQDVPALAGTAAALLADGIWLVLRCADGVMGVRRLCRLLSPAARRRLLVVLDDGRTLRCTHDGRLRPAPGSVIPREGILVIDVGGVATEVPPTSGPGGRLRLRDPAAFRAWLAEESWRRRASTVEGEDADRRPDDLLRAPVDPAWQLVEGTEGYLPALEHEIESRFAFGNGFIGTRGALELPAYASRPQAFVAGLFVPAVRPYDVSRLVPIPDWTRLRLTIDGTAPPAVSDGSRDHVRVLDFSRGLLLGSSRVRGPSGEEVRLQTLRLVSRRDRAVAVHLARIVVDRPVWLTLTAPQPPADPALLWRSVGPDVGYWSCPSAPWLLAVAGHAELIVGRHRCAVERHRGGWRWSWLATPDTPAFLRRIVAFERGDGPEGDAVAGALAGATAAALRRAVRCGPARLTAGHTRAWAERLAAGDVEIAGDAEAQRAVRFAVYHLIAAADPHDDRVSIGARALTGEAYHGHVFWDTECFLLPFYTYTWPAAARALLRYRHHTLPAARAKAVRLGYRGALFAWESTDTGAEATPPLVLGRRGEVIPIRCGTDEQHISADIALAVWRYWEATHDRDFLLDCGAEIVLETARFWASRARLEADGRYHIRGVIGPDEYHEGVDDNAYTNGMAAWNLECGDALARLLARRWPARWMALRAALALDEAELATWPVVAAGMHVAHDRAGGLIEQFAGYFALEAIDLARYADRSVPMDVVLGAERTRGSQVSKQADVVMLLANLWERYAPATRLANFRYYEPRCGHGSSLSPAVHALVAARLGDAPLAERYFHQAGAIDLDDSMGNAAGGVHIAALGGLWQAAVFGFAGLSFARDGVRLSPCLPATWDSLRFGVCWRGRRVRCTIARASASDELTITLVLEHGRPLNAHVGAQWQRLRRGSPWEVTYAPDSPAGDPGGGDPR